MTRDRESGIEISELMHKLDLAQCIIMRQYLEHLYEIKIWNECADRTERVYGGCYRPQAKQ